MKNSAKEMDGAGAKTISEVVFELAEVVFIGKRPKSRRYPSSGIDIRG